MAKRLRLHLSRLLPSFNSCRSSSSTSTSSISPRAPNPPTSPYSNHHSPSYWCREPNYHVLHPTPSPRLKIDSDDGDDLFPPLSLPRPSYRRAMQEKLSRKSSSTHHHPPKKKKKRRPARPRASSSSADTDWFSTEDDDGEILMECSSSSASGRRRRRVLLRRLVMCTEEKVKGSLAVVKRSEDPYGDFKRSIVQMVTERGLFEEAELRGLLRCFLSLNSPDHHEAILRAFSEVCDALFLVL